MVQPLRKLTKTDEAAPIALAPARGEDWRALGGHALEAAGGTMPAWIEPQVQILGSSSPPLGIWQKGRLLGVVALERQNARWLPGWPVDVSFETPFFFSGLPLIAEDRADAAIESLIADRGVPLLLKSIPIDGPFWDALCRATRKLNAPVAIIAQWQRAALRPGGNYSAWFETNFERKRRKEYRRWRARLGEMGKLESLNWKQGERLDPWFADFLALEAKGWKGKRGSAIGCDAALSDCLRSQLEQLAQAGHLRFWSIRLDGRPIASLFAHVIGGKAWLGKIAFDEDHAKYSPGVLQILDATEALFAEGDIALADSCAAPDHPMIDNIWRDRIMMADLLIGTPNMPPARFKAMMAAEAFRRRGRNAAKDVYNRFIRRQKS
ncbi:MAG: GNAT family N-acetyltransferase [Rhizobiales bacterium]|nr:GNAT family N-acetyltransferase [Hyphomicrobiales bacterium]